MYLGRRQAGGVLTKPVNRRRTVAVLNFKNSTSRAEATWLSTALPEMLTTELAAGEKLRTIAGGEVAQMKMSLALPASESLSAQTLSQVGEIRADHTATPYLTAQPGGVVRIRNREPGERVRIH